MVASIQQIIGKINPELYAENGKELLKKYNSPSEIPAEEVKPKTPTEHKIVYDSASEQLEPVYFFMLDLMDDFGLSPKKFIDNFTSSPGSGHFSELGQRATVMQQQGTKLMADINTVLRSILNLIYDLKEFRIRLQSYDDLKNGKNNNAARLSLKQIWMDKVDIQKGNSSIKAMALGQAGFQTLIDAFLVVEDEKNVDKLDLNDRVKRILRPRIMEFNHWLGQSEQELRKRYELEKTYLKSQVNSLKIYSRWARPYLKAANQLEASEGASPALVKTFNTIILELTLFGKEKISPEPEMGKIKPKRDYYGCVLVEFNFRGIPQRVSQRGDYAFGGKVEMTFTPYNLNQDELERLNLELEESDVNDALKLIEGATTESLGQLQEEIDYFLEETPSKEKASKDVSNPFLALIGYYGKNPKKANKKAGEGKKEDKNKKIRKDDWIEKTHLRPLAKKKAKEIAFSLFNIYKKAHGMVNYD